MVLPTTAQQRGMAYAPMPFGFISFLSSSCMIYHLVVQERQKLKRMYHRLVLAMNVALLPLSFTYAWSTLAVPEGTPYYAGAMGTVNTCTAHGFIRVTFAFAVSTYYVSLILQALLGVRNNFKEERYRYIEIPIHLVAYCLPCAYTIMTAATENFNPSASGCWYGRAPRGCESDPEVECQRGKDIKYFATILGFTSLVLYVIFPTLVALAMYFWMQKSRKVGRKVGSVGMSIIREKARKEMMQSCYLQVSFYLFTFWSTWVLNWIHSLYQVLTGDIIYNLVILGNCICALQGFVFMVVYFTLQKMGGRPKLEYLCNNALPSDRRQLELTVGDIRSNAERKIEDGLEESTDNVEERFSFNIFDGEPDPNSPWAIFFDQGDYSDDEDAPDEGEQSQPNEGMEQAHDEGGR